MGGLSKAFKKGHPGWGPIFVDNPPPPAHGEIWGTSEVVVLLF